MTLLPSALTSLNNWLVWKLEQHPNEPKPRKVPYYVNGERRRGTQGAPQDRSMLSSHAAAKAAVENGGYTGLGFALMPEDGIVALDFDKCITEGVIDPRIERMVAGTYSEISPSGVGIRAFMRGTMQSRKDNASEAERNSDGTRKDGQFDIEIFGHSGFVTVTGNTAPDCSLFGLEDTVCAVTEDVKALYRKRFGNEGALVVQSGEADDLMGLMPTLGWSFEEARGYLADCDPSTDRDHWLKALMAIHHELSGSPEALDMVDEWSSKASNYAGRSDVADRWRSFGRGSSVGGGTGVTTGLWLLKWRSECLSREKYAAADEWKKEISAATDEASIREKICPKIQGDERLDDFAREALARLLVDTFKRMGTTYGIQLCRKLVLEKHEQKTDGELPQWLGGWVYVTDDDRFYRIDSDEWLTVQGFNIRFNRNLPLGDSGAPIGQASDLATTHYQIPIVTRALYLPWAGAIFELNGVKCVNKYRPSSPPTAVESMSYAGVLAKGVIMKHLNLICGGRKDVVRTLVNWIAHNVQKPGVKVRWAPLIKGIEGDGKSLIGQLMGCVMGAANVKSVSPKVLGTDFTGWSENAAVVTLEELKLTGHSRWDILNALKPFITNDDIEVHRKGKDGRNTINTVNYIAFTNYADALPLTDTDRRWWIVFTPFSDKDGLAAAVGAGPNGVELVAYFNSIHDVIQKNGAELRRWLLDHPIDSDFQPNASAPMTDEKAVMIGMSIDEEQRAVQDILEKGGVGITQDVFASSYVNSEVVASNADISLATSSWSRLLIKMGYTRLPKKLKWRGKTEIIWVKGHRNLPLEKARELLDKTAEGSQSEDLF